MVYLIIYVMVDKYLFWTGYWRQTCPEQEKSLSHPVLIYDKTKQNISLKQNNKCGVWTECLSNSKTQTISTISLQVQFMVLNHYILDGSLTPSFIQKQPSTVSHHGKHQCWQLQISSYEKHVPWLLFPMLLCRICPWNWQPIHQQL